MIFAKIIKKELFITYSVELNHWILFSINPIGPSLSHIKTLLVFVHIYVQSFKKRSVYILNRKLILSFPTLYRAEWKIMTSTKDVRARCKLDCFSLQLHLNVSSLDSPLFIIHSLCMIDTSAISCQKLILNPTYRHILFEIDFIQSDIIQYSFIVIT